jgi:hypothetical protein
MRNILAYVEAEDIVKDVKSTSLGHQVKHLTELLWLCFIVNLVY